MTPDSNLHERMAGLARDLRSRESAHGTLQHIVDAAVEMIDGCDSAGISLAVKDGEITTSACTDDLTRRADELQQELGEGPCMDAAWREHVVSAPDLATDERWPRWGPAAVEELGVRSSLCLQLFTHEDRLGGLNLFSHRRDAFDAEDVEEARAIAAHAAVAMMAAYRIDQLSGALQSRTITAQAVGMTMTTYGVSSHQAFAMLRRVSNEQNVKLRVLAARMIAEHDEAASR